jgi:AmmeMemoRadiSam system protein A
MPAVSEALARRLLYCAATAINAAVRNVDVSCPYPDLSDAPFNGVFVTVRVHGELRGCIGFIELTSPLGPFVAEAARRSCTSDTRFPPVVPDELRDLSFEISLLTPRERITSASDIEIGQHGLVLEFGERRGLLLPQVPVEQGWDTGEFLAGLCRKTGLPADAWRHADASLWRFSGTQLRAPLLKPYLEHDMHANDTGDEI